MTELPEYDEAATLEKNLREIHEIWKGLRDLASKGYKGWLTQTKNHYLRLVHADPDAAAEMLACHEFYSSLVRKHGRRNPNIEEQQYLSDLLMPPSSSITPF